MKKQELKKLIAAVAAVCVCATNTTSTYAVSKNGILEDTILKSSISQNETVVSEEVSKEDSYDTVSYNHVSGDKTTQKEKSETVSANSVLEQSISENETTYKDAEYVVYVEDGALETVAEVEEVMQEASNVVEEDLEDATLYVADLTAEQAEELANTNEKVYIEENIEIVASQSKMSKVSKNDKKNAKKKGNKQKENKTKQEQNKTLEQAIESSKYDEYEWNMQMIHVDSKQVPQSGERIKVAVLDSGVELITDINVVKSVNLVKDEQDITFYMNDMTGHGTAIADVIYDINPNADIYAVRVLDSDNRASLSTIIEGIKWCMQEDVDIINMSFGTNAESEILRQTIKEAYDQGILLIASAGNGGSEAGVEYPAAYEEVMAVGAVDTSAVKTEESATGEEVEIVAPGEQIRATSMLGFETVTSGTSMAVPHITGVASVLWQKDKTKSSDFIRDLLTATAIRLGSESQYGSGLVDLEYALSCYDEFSKKYHPQEKEESTPSQTQISPNEAEVETFEDVNYVEGRWASGQKDNLGHWDMAEYAINGAERMAKIWVLVDLSTGKEYTNTEPICTDKEIKLFKWGAIYPDWEVSGCKSRPEWHGKHTQNYMANYIYATRIALYGGNTSKAKKVKGQTDATYTAMKGLISTSGISGKSWNKIFLDTTEESGYKNTKRNRQIFLYGMALHAITDTFAHSVWVEATSHPGVYFQLVHAQEQSTIPNNYADDPTKYPARYKSAEDAAYCVYANFVNQSEGDVEDFIPVDKYRGKFKLGNCMKYALEVGSKDYSNKELGTLFAPMNLDV